MNFKDDEKYVIINYNAWKSDSWKNAFQTLMCCILDNEIFNTTDDMNNLKEMGNELRNIAMDIGKGFVKKQISKLISEDVVEALDEKI